MSLERLHGLIVSVQPVGGSALDDPEIVAALAACALANGAVGVRIEGAHRIKAVRTRVGDAPIIGLIKRVVSGFEPYITASLADVESVLDAGAEIVAVDATPRPRADGSTFADAVQTIHGRGGSAFADCAVLDDARAALAARADVVATTLCGYTAETRGTKLPALGLVGSMAALGAFTVCEGGVAAPQQVAAAFAAGAAGVVVGTAITNIDLLVRRFADAAVRPG